MSDFTETSYSRHAQGYANDLVNPERKKIAASWFDLSTANSWRFERIYKIAGYLGGLPGEKWLTVGDGRFGLDAIRLKAHGASEVLATDLDESLLRKAQQDGHLERYQVENAERLSFPDSSFDAVFCKESYHHFPRPAIALYEMLRVAKRGVILAEPNDRERSPLRLLMRLLGSKVPAETYEEDGNYVYSISEREITKVALGLNLPQVAFKRFNDAYLPGLEFAPLDSAAGRNMRRKIAIRDTLCLLGLDHCMSLMACLLHSQIGS
jgi:SAM-dependent methyltransferase